MKRLECVLKYIKGEILVDIGCDHGYLTIDAVKSGKVKQAYALDVNELPLENAKKNINQACLSDKINTVLSNGLDDFDLEFDCLTICGMGGILMCDILKRGLNKLKNVKTIILEPNNNQNIVREFLNNNNFFIINEDLCYEKGHIYEIIVVEHGKMNLTKMEIDFGPINLVKKDELFIKKYKSILESLENSIKHASEESKLQLEEKIKYIKEAIGGF